MNTNQRTGRSTHDATRAAKCNTSRVGSRRFRTPSRQLETPERLEPRALLAVGAAGPLPLPVQSLDGIGNNLARPEWGSTGEQFLRRSPAAYADGASSLSEG